MQWLTGELSLPYGSSLCVRTDGRTDRRTDGQTALSLSIAPIARFHRKKKTHVRTSRKFRPADSSRPSFPARKRLRLASGPQYACRKQNIQYTRSAAGCTPSIQHGPAANPPHLSTMYMYSGPVKHISAPSSPEAGSYMPVGLAPPAPYRSSRASLLSAL